MSFRGCALILLLAMPAFAAGPTAEERAIVFLSREVPRWSRENGCFSCHNDGDGARALLVAQRRGWKVDAAALRATTAWLSAPEKWDSNRGDPAISDKKLARIQFAAALAETPETPAMRRAAQLLAKDQAQDGSWRTEGAEAAVGSPVTYGLAMATWLAKRVMEKGGQPEAAARAGRWFLVFEPRNHLDAAATALAQEGAKREACFSLLRRGQNPDGGWGPYAGTPSEAFDTAAALLALARSAADAGRVARGREFLRKAQLESGGWPETTRPSGGQSYAQHISTSAWALLALIETKP
jgi:prenyltransferase/squalene oxidase-like repeat protein